MFPENLYKISSNIKSDIDNLNDHYRIVVGMKNIPENFTIDYENPICPICNTNCHCLLFSNFPKWVEKMFEKRRKELS